MYLPPNQRITSLDEGRIAPGQALPDPLGGRWRPPLRLDTGRACAHVPEQVRHAGHGRIDGALLVDRERGGDPAADLPDEDVALGPVIGPAEPLERGRVLRAGRVDVERGGCV